MEKSERQEYVQKITLKLVIFTGSILVLLAIGIYSLIYSEWGKEKSYLVLIVFACGLLGGFVSIQQRLPKISSDELRILSGSWVSITLIPINGGIFALVLMLIFAGHILQGQMFPDYPEKSLFLINNVKDFNDWLMKDYPVTGVDVAKLLFWSFVAGFSERFVPQVIRKATDKTISE